MGKRSTIVESKKDLNTMAPVRTTITQRVLRPVFEEGPPEGGDTDKPARYPKIILKAGQSFRKITGKKSDLPVKNFGES
jgi:hypothetical protein